MKDEGIPGLGLCVSDKEGPLYCKPYGTTLIGGSHHYNVTTSTIFSLGTLSTAVVWVALFQLNEKNIIRLDERIQNYLDFTIDYPFAAEYHGTFRHLLIHSSSLVDNKDVMEKYVVYDHDHSVSLRDFLHGYLNNEGKEYREENFMDYAPGCKAKYSDIGVCLAALLVEQISNLPFPEYCQQNIFGPLGMNNTSFSFSQYDKSTLFATPYKKKTMLRKYSAPYYPCECLKSTIEDMSKFLTCLVSDGQYGDYQLLSRNTIDMIRRRQVYLKKDTLGLGFFIVEPAVYYQNGFYGFDGFGEGIKASLWIEPEKGIGCCLLMNSETAKFDDICDMCFEKYHLLKGIEDENENNRATKNFKGNKKAKPKKKK